MGGGGGASGSAGTAGNSLELRLEAIPGLRVVGSAVSGDGSRSFDLAFEQPNDHKQPDGPKFEQSIRLLHHAADAPMVLSSTGYDLAIGVGGGSELVPALAANELVIEHRFFGSSRPDPLDWSLLNIQQSAADTHRIVEALRAMYAGSWLSTGASKGGMTSVYHRRFYPDDVVGTVAYVTPISFGAPDSRYLDFLDSVGGPEQAACRERLAAIQVEALERRAGLVSRIVAILGMTEDEAERSLESTVVDFPFSFWQYLGATYCGWLPATGATDDEFFDFLFFTTPSYGDPDAQLRFLPYYYQTYTELGYPAIRMEHIAHLLETEPFSVADALPGVTIEFQPSVMQDISSWVKSEGNRLMFVYGAYDPWTAGAFELGGATDSYVFVQSQGTHSAAIGSLSDADQLAAYAVVERWAGISPARAATARAAPKSSRVPQLERRVLPPVPR